MIRQKPRNESGGRGLVPVILIRTVEQHYIQSDRNCERIEPSLNLQPGTEVSHMIKQKKVEHSERSEQPKR